MLLQLTKGVIKLTKNVYEIIIDQIKKVLVSLLIPSVSYTPFHYCQHYVMLFWKGLKKELVVFTLKKFKMICFKFDL